MKKITIDDLEWQKDPHYFTPTRTKSYYGRARDVQVIVIHWWNDPDRAGTLEPTADYLERADTSVHYVVSGDRVIQMVNMGNTAFHARSANPISVGIEVDPNTPGNTYETVGALVRFIRSYYGNIPLKKHSDYVNTTCPGTISLKKIEQYAKEPNMPTLTTKTDLNRIYKDSLQRSRNKGEGEDVYLNKDYRFVHKDVFNSDEAKKRRKIEEKQDELRHKQAATIKELQNELKIAKSSSKEELQKAIERADKLSTEVTELEKEIVRKDAELEELRNHKVQRPLTWKRVMEWIIKKIGA